MLVTDLGERIPVLEGVSITTPSEPGVATETSIAVQEDTEVTSEEPSLPTSLPAVSQPSSIPPTTSLPTTSSPRRSTRNRVPPERYGFSKTRVQS